MCFTFADPIKPKPLEYHAFSRIIPGYIEMDPEKIEEMRDQGRAFARWAAQKGIRIEEIDAYVCLLALFNKLSVQERKLWMPYEMCFVFGFLSFLYSVNYAYHANTHVMSKVAEG